MKKFLTSTIILVISLSAAYYFIIALPSIRQQEEISVQKLLDASHEEPKQEEIEDIKINIPPPKKPIPAEIEETKKRILKNNPPKPMLVPPRKKIDARAFNLGERVKQMELDKMKRDIKELKEKQYWEDIKKTYDGIYP